MAINIGEILALLTKLEGMGELIADTWKKIQEHAEQEADAKKREKLLEACKSRDAAAVRAIWFSVGDE